MFSCRLRLNHDSRTGCRLRALARLKGPAKPRSSPLGYQPKSLSPWLWQLPLPPRLRRRICTVRFSGSTFPRALVRAWPFCFMKLAKGFLPIRDACILHFSNHNHSLQLLSLTSPWGGFVGNSHKWGPLMLQGTLGFASDFDFLRGLFSVPTVSEVHGLSPNTPGGSLKY